MGKTILTEKDENKICALYESGVCIAVLCQTYKVGKLKIKKILADNGIQTRKPGGQKENINYVVSDWKIEKYHEAKEGYHYVYVDKSTNFKTTDIKNLSGVLTSYIKKQYGVNIPSLYDRRMYYMKTGNYWWEQWLTIDEVKNREVKTCPYCGWETVDIDNKTGAFSVHLDNAHNMTVEKHLEIHPEDADYFSVTSRRMKREKMLENPQNYIKCPICGKKMFRMTLSHIVSHGMTLSEFKANFPDFKMESELMLELDRLSQSVCNKAPRKSTRRSSAEIELSSFLEKNGIEHKLNDRTILGGKEIDLLIESKKLGIEYDGLRYHYGNENRHITKTKLANKMGYKLIHIFEDEYLGNKELVYDKIKHFLGLNVSNEKIGARNCKICEISSETARNFLNAYHLQGFSNSSVYLGAFHAGKLVGVMTFRRCYLDMDCEWELNRFATDIKYRCQGLASKMFKWFVRNFGPNSVVSFADRRWTLCPIGNLYTKIGFQYVGETRPSYTYFKKNGATGCDRVKRYHKLDFRKRILMEKNKDFTKDMTEEEMAKKLGFYRIWDCGLFKYVWQREETE